MNPKIKSQHSIIQEAILIPTCSLFSSLFPKFLHSVTLRGFGAWHIYCGSVDFHQTCVWTFILCIYIQSLHVADIKHGYTQ